MSDAIANFFGAWEIADADTRLAKIKGAVTENVTYDDPRTPETVNGIDALSDYVGMFSANAPGWTASVVKSDTIANVTRATVAFGGKGPDGSEHVQLGQYFVETNGERITRMVGFAGMGEAD